MQVIRKLQNDNTMWQQGASAKSAINPQMIDKKIVRKKQFNNHAPAVFVVLSNGFVTIKAQQTIPAENHKMNSFLADTRQSPKKLNPIKIEQKSNKIFSVPSITAFGELKKQIQVYAIRRRKERKPNFSSNGFTLAFKMTYFVVFTQ